MLPEGSFTFIASVMTGLVCIAGICLSLRLLVMPSWPVERVAPSLIVTFICLLIAEVHGSFMLTRGKDWALLLLKILSGAFVLLFLAGSLLSLTKNSPLWFPLTGLTVSVIHLSLIFSAKLALFKSHFQNIHQGLPR